MNVGDILLLMFETVHPGEKEQGKGQRLGDPPQGGRLRWRSQPMEVKDSQTILPSPIAK